MPVDTDPRATPAPGDSRRRRSPQEAERRVSLVALLALLLVPVLAACGADESASTAVTPPAAAPPAATVQDTAPETAPTETAPATTALPEATTEPATTALPEATTEPATTAAPEATSGPATPTVPETGDHPVGERLAAALARRTFVIERARLGDEVSPVHPQTLLSFTVDTVAYFPGCNTSSGAYSLVGDRLDVSGRSETLASCEGRPVAAAGVGAIVFGRPRLMLDGDELVLHLGSSTLWARDRERADPDRPLAGRSWQIAGYATADGDASLQEAPWMAGARIGFGSDGRFTLRAACGRFTGRYEITADELQVRFPIDLADPCFTGDPLQRDQIASIWGRHLIVEATEERAVLHLGAYGGTWLVLEAPG